ncbi:MAG TPA: ABC transporter permease [Candidatus Omnitrophota bacterium]|nr:ABC transporter permease [Candidatus Omnitrophota bacterium]
MKTVFGNTKIKRWLLPAALLGTVFICSAGADWLAPYSPQAESRTYAYHPPSRVHFRDGQGKLSLFRPFVYQTRLSFDSLRRRHYTEETGEKFYLKFFGRRFISVPEPAKIYLLGTDPRGRDVFSRILFGTRVSLAAALLGVALATTIGFLVGGIAGYFGGWTDHFLMRVSEFFIMIPGFYLLLALRSTLPAGLDSRQTFLLIVLILSMIGWGSLSRVVRGMTLSLKEREFVAAAKVLGRGPFGILTRHILPHLVSYLGVAVSLAIPGYILGESALSLLGLGIQDPDVSLGNLLQDCMSIPSIQLSPWVLAPGFWLAFISFCFYLLGDRIAQSGEIQ